MDVDAADVVVSRAVSDVLATFGPEVLGDARRVRACLTDDLGQQARPRRAEIGAVVIAVEEGVAEQLRSPTFDRATAVQALLARGLSSDVAAYAIDVWRHGLGLNGPNSVAPALPSVVEAAAIADDMTDPGIVVDLTDHALATDGLSVEALSATGAVLRTDATPGPARRRTPWLIAGGVLTAAVLLLAFLVFGGSDDGGTTIVTKNDPATMLRFDSVQLPWGAELSRVWSAKDTGLHAELSFKNTTAAAVTGRHIEAIPKSLADSADQVHSTPLASEILQADPVLAYDVTVEAGATTTITYDIENVVANAGNLSAWQTEQAAALTQYESTTTTTMTTTTTTSIPTVPPPPDTTVIPTVSLPTTPNTQNTVKVTSPKPTTPKVTTPVVTTPVVTAPPVTAPVVTTPPVVPLVANNDTFSQAATKVSCGGVSQGGYCYAQIPMNVTRNDSGPFTAGGYVRLPTKGELLWDSVNYLYLYVPGQAGPYSDSFTYQLSNKSGQVSNVATVTINIS